MFMFGTVFVVAVRSTWRMSDTCCYEYELISLTTDLYVSVPLTEFSTQMSRTWTRLQK